MNFVRKYFIMQQINGHYSLGRNKLAHPLEEQVYSNTTIIIWGKTVKMTSLQVTSQCNQKLCDLSSFTWYSTFLFKINLAYFTVLSLVVCSPSLQLCNFIHHASSCLMKTVPYYLPIIYNFKCVVCLSMCLWQLGWNGNINALSCWFFSLKDCIFWINSKLTFCFNCLVNIILELRFYRVINNKVNKYSVWGKIFVFPHWKTYATNSNLKVKLFPLFSLSKIARTSVTLGCQYSKISDKLDYLI